MPYSRTLVTDDTGPLSKTGIICAAIGAVAVVICNLAGGDSLESLVAFIAATYGAATVMPFRMG